MFCKAPLRTTFVDLGMHPLCESYVSEDKLDAMESFYPLHVYVCEQCFLVQLNEYVSPADIFTWHGPPRATRCADPDPAFGRRGKAPPGRDNRGWKSKSR